MQIIGLNYAPEPTGIAPYTTGMARFLAEAGHDVHVVTGYPHYPYWRVSDGYRGVRRREVLDGVRITRVRHPVPRRAIGRERVAMEATFALHAASVAATRGCRPDVVLAVSPSLLSVAGALRWTLRGVPVGVVTQDLYARAIAEAHALRGKGARTVAGLERALLGRCAGVVAIHDQFRDSLVRLGIESDRITTIRNWTHVGPPVTDALDTRRELGWRDDETIVLHAGNMGRKQGLENVVEAARRADEARLPVRFVLLGAGNEREVLAERAREVARLELLDPLPAGRFESALAAADVLLLNERPEVAEMCVPSKLTSYFAAGRPVLAATSPCSAATRELAASGAGECVAPFDPDALLAAARRLAEDTAAAEAMGRRGRRYAHDVLSREAAREAYLAWVDRLVVGAPTLPAPRDPADAVPEVTDLAGAAALTGEPA